LDIEIRRARELPGPGEYYTEDPEVPRKLPGGKFNTGRSKTQLEWTIYNAKKSPGPGEYSIDQPSKYVKRIVPKFSFSGRPGPATMPAPYGHKFVSSPYIPFIIRSMV
jgi:Sperm-tail PG-rich repeat